MNFSRTLRGVVRSGDAWHAEVGADWLQGRSAFGGLQAALGLRAMRDLVPAAMPLRALQVTFLAPVLPGALVLRAALLRQGRSTCHVEASLLAGDAVACRLLGVFGTARPSTLRVAPVEPVVDNPAAPVLRYDASRMPAFLQHFDARWLRGDVPFSGGHARSSVIEVSLHDAGPVDETHVLAFADFIPPIALSMLAAPAPGSSVSWMLEMLDGVHADMGLAHWRIDAELVAARDGYTSQDVMLWGPQGEPVARGRQSMLVFA